MCCLELYLIFIASSSGGLLAMCALTVSREQLVFLKENLLFVCLNYN